MRKAIVWTILTLVATAAWADREVSQSVPAEPGGEVSIELISGKIEIIGWDRDEVEVTGTVGDDVREVTVESERGEVSIDLEIEDGQGRSRDIDARLEIRVPRESSVEVESVSAGIDVDGLDGDLSIESVSGGVKVRGSIRRLEVETVSGRVEVESDSPLAEAEFESVSGGISLRAPLSPDGSFSFESVSGGIELHLPRDTRADFEVETFSGSIVNELGPPARREDDHAPGMSLQFRVGGGGARVEIEAFSGKVEIRER